jgi:hypothetical protein
MLDIPFNQNISFNKYCRKLKLKASAMNKAAPRAPKGNNSREEEQGERTHKRVRVRKSATFNAFFFTIL